MTKLISLIIGSVAVLYFVTVGIQYSIVEARQEVVAWALRQPEAGYKQEDRQAMTAAFDSSMPPPLNVAELDEGILNAR
jgi:hypothetical protein